MPGAMFPCPRCGKPLRLPARSASGITFPCPHCGVPLKLSARQERAVSGQADDDSDIPVWDPPTRSHADGLPRDVALPNQSAPPDFLPADLPAAPRVTGEEATLDDVPSPIRALRARRRQRARIPIVPISVAGGLMLIAALFFWDRAIRQREQSKRPAAPPASNVAESNASPQQTRPTPERVDARQPIRLLLTPDGARMIVHLRPSEFWTGGDTESAQRDQSVLALQVEARASEVRRCLGPLADWTQQQIAARCLFPPEQISEILFAFVLRTPDEPSGVAATVWLTRPTSTEEILKRFGGQLRSGKRPGGQGSLPIYVNGDRALVIRDATTFAVGPQSAVDEMADATREQNPTDESIEELLKQTDRSRQVTLIFRPDDLDRFREALFPRELTEFVHRLAAWIDPEAVEGVALSLRLAEPIRLRLTLRNRPATPVGRLEEDVQKRLDRLPGDVLAHVRSLHPPTSGYRKLIGRVPAMWKAVALGTASSTQPRLVTFESVLPPRAAANLSLATYLMLAEGPAASGPDGPLSDVAANKKTLAERLQTRIDVDFRRTPLSEAFDWIGDSIGAKFDLDGGALKLAGYTKNMPQTFRASQSPALAILRTMLKPYSKMALVVDEVNQKVVVTTREAAKTSGRKTLSLDQ